MCYYRGQLSKLGCIVDQATNGLIAVEKMKSTPPPHYDVILLDLEMPIKGKLDTRTSVMANDII